MSEKPTLQAGERTQQIESSDSTFHRDGSVTLWDVYRQGWLRTKNPSDEVLASLGWEEREKVIAHTAAGKR